MAGKKGRSGVKVIPDDVKELIGYRKDRMHNDRPSVIQKAFPVEELTGHAREFFDKHFRSMYESGILSDTDAAAFCLLCRVYEQMRIAEDCVAVEGQTVETKRGPQTTAAARNFMQLSGLYVQLLREFGMTPVSRGSVQKMPEPIEVKQPKRGSRSGRKPNPGKGYAGANLA